jgi:hypothetical protein
VVTVATGNANLVPASILLGSFLVPVAVVSSAFGHADEVVTAQRVVTAVGGGGVLGVLGAWVLESPMPPSGSAPSRSASGRRCGHPPRHDPAQRPRPAVRHRDRRQAALGDAAAAYDDLLRQVAAGEISLDIDPEPLAKVEQVWPQAGSDRRIVFVP